MKHSHTYLTCRDFVKDDITEFFRDFRNNIDTLEEEVLSKIKEDLIEAGREALNSAVEDGEEHEESLEEKDKEIEELKQEIIDLEIEIREARKEILDLERQLHNLQNQEESQ